MDDLKIDTMIGTRLNGAGNSAVNAEELGFDGAFTPTEDNDGFLSQPLIGNRTESIQLGTRIALAFTRSPMSLAYSTWELARFTNGRFILGLGTQVKGHNERRFSVEWSNPGPRLREVIEALRHIFKVFQEGIDLDYQGKYHQFSLMTEKFNPGPIENPNIPIWIAAVNEYNIRTAGKLCDGLAMHPFNTPKYMDEVIAPTVAEEVGSNDRSMEDVELSASPLVITGETEAIINRERENVRRQISFYGSTRTYHDVLEAHGWKHIGEKLHELSQKQRWDDMADLVTDEMVATFAIEAKPDEIITVARETYGDVADRIILPLEHGESFMQGNDHP